MLRVLRRGEDSGGNTIASGVVGRRWSVLGGGVVEPSSFASEDAFKIRPRGVRDGRGNCARNESGEVVVSETTAGASGHESVGRSGFIWVLGPWLRTSPVCLVVAVEACRKRVSGCSDAVDTTRSSGLQQGHREAHGGIPCRGVVPRTGVMYNVHTGIHTTDSSSGTSVLCMGIVVFPRDTNLAVLLLKFCRFFSRI